MSRINNEENWIVITSLLDITFRKLVESIYMF